jgi:hypothetical protein
MKIGIFETGEDECGKIKFFIFFLRVLCGPMGKGGRLSLPSSIKKNGGGRG